MSADTPYEVIVTSRWIVYATCAEDAEDRWCNDEGDPKEQDIVTVRPSSSE